MSVIIRLQKLPLTANASDVRGFFKGLSIPDGGVHIVGGELGDAFIAFSTDEDARQAMALNGGRINNEPVMLLLSSRAEMQKVIDQARNAALRYMQLSRAAASVASAVATAPVVSATTCPKDNKPSLVSGPAVGPVGALVGAGRSHLTKFNSPPLGANASPSAQKQQQQPQPPVISLAGFLAKARGGAPTSSLVGRTATDVAPTVVAPAAVAVQQAASLSPLLSQGAGSSYSEIPGLSFLAPAAAGNNGGGGANEAVDALSPLGSGNLTGWLSALNGQLFNKALNGGAGMMDRIDTSFLANSVTPVNLNGMQKDATNQQSQWKFLKKDRRSRSPSRERPFRRMDGGRSRSPSRDREHKGRDRRSRSSSRGRNVKRGGGGRSRSSSRDRRSRSWSRGSSRDYSGSSNRRYRNSRSRSSSRDRFGRTRHRSRSRSLTRNHRNRDGSRDRSRESSNSRWDRDQRQPGGANRSRSSHFSNAQNHQQHQHNNHQQPQNPWNTMDKPFGGNVANPEAQYGDNGAMMPREVEPIFGLHTAAGARAVALASLAAVNYFPGRSGKISPLPMANGFGGSHFRNTSPLPDSVYSGVSLAGGANSNGGAPTSDYAIKISNFESVTGYGEIRRFFKTLMISTQGIKMINDQHGRRTGAAYVQFLRKEGKRMALLRDGSAMRRFRVRIESVTDQEFEQAIDSYRPGSDKSTGYNQQQQHQQLGPSSVWGNDSGSSGSNAPWNSNSSLQRDEPWDAPSQASGNDNSSEANRDEQAGGREQGRHRTPGHGSTSALMVWNLPTFTTEQDIMKIFSDFTVVEVLIVKNHTIAKQLDGYVRFHRQEDAKDAWSQVHRHYIGNKKVTVRMCPELDYAVAKNEYENPSDAVAQSGSTESQHDERRSSEEGRYADGGHDQTHSAIHQSNDDDQHHGQQQRGGGNRNENNNAGGQDRKAGGARKKRWDTERNWDEEEDEDERPRAQSASSPPSMMMDAGDAGAGSDTNASWVDRDSRMNHQGNGRDSSLGNDSSGHYFNDNNGDDNGDGGNNNGNGMNSRDPRRQKQDSSRGRFGDGGGGDGGDNGGGGDVGGNSGDNSELFQRTTCLLLRNVDFNVYEEDVFQFFAQDGFRAKSVLLVRNERGKRTGECLVEFESPAEAAHAESKSSQNLGRRKVFASHLDRGQVAELMKRFDAIAEGRRSPGDYQPESQRDGNQQQCDQQQQRDQRQRQRHDDPEDNQGVGCGPYRTSTVGLLNLAYKTTVEDVQNFFREFDLPHDSVRRRFLDNGQATGEAMVRFRNHLDAEKALNEYQNRKLFGRNVRIRLINDD